MGTSREHPGWAAVRELPSEVESLRIVFHLDCSGIL